jgi:hypothetical protein
MDGPLVYDLTPFFDALGLAPVTFPPSANLECGFLSLGNEIDAMNSCVFAV